MAMKSTHLIQLLSLLTVSQASDQKVLANDEVAETMPSTQVFDYKLSIIKLPDEVKEAVNAPSVAENGWGEFEWSQFGEPFEYDLNTQNRTLEDVAKLHILNANSGKFFGNNYTKHQIRYDGNLSTVAYDDFVYLYYGNGDNGDILTLNYDIPFYTNGIAPGKPTPAPEA